MDTERQAAAYHEAGHAATHLHFGHDVLQVTIEDDSEAAGHVYTYGLMMYEPRHRKTLVREHIIVCYAGGEAQRRITPSVEPWHVEDDEAQAFDLLRECPPRGVSYVGDDAYCARLEQLRSEARRLVGRLWPEIERIAAALLERGTLSGAELRQVCELVDRTAKRV